MTRLLRKRGGFYCDLEELSLHLLEDIRAYKRNDPAARSAIEVVLLYNGLHATIDYRIAHWFYRHRCFFIARAISQWSKMWTGIEIHRVLPQNRAFSYHNFLKQSALAD